MTYSKANPSPFFSSIGEALAHIDDDVGKRIYSYLIVFLFHLNVILFLPQREYGSKKHNTTTSFFCSNI
jgi:hypothetical protein